MDMVLAHAPWSPLVDKFGRQHTYLRVSLTDRCNFRCQYCMPAEGVVCKDKSEIMSLEEIVRLSSIFVRLGVTKIRLTGGEPTVRKGLTELARDLRALPGVERLLMTTNGYTLAGQAQAYRDAGIDGLNVSLDSLRSGRFAEITRGAELARVLAGLEAGLAAGFQSVKVNVVAMHGVNDDELCDFVEFGQKLGIHVRFIEFMPFLGNDWSKGRVFTYQQMLDRISEKFELIPLEVEKSAVAKEFRVKGSETTIGFVTSVTHDFCGGCNRLRLTADGKIKTCLFLTAGRSLLQMLREGASDLDIAEAIRFALSQKWAGHPPMERLLGKDNLAMVQIGG